MFLLSVALAVGAAHPAAAAPKHIKPKHVKVETKSEAKSRSTAHRHRDDHKSTAPSGKVGRDAKADAAKRSKTSRDKDRRDDSTPRSRGRPAAAPDHKAARSHDDRSGQLDRILLPILRPDVPQAAAPEPAYRPSPRPANLLPPRALIVDQALRVDGRIDFARLDARFDRLAHAPGLVGMAVAIVDRGKLVFVKGYGVTKFGGDEPVTAHTVFRWASLSKTVAATMVGKLVDQGQLSLDDPIAKFGTTLRLPLGAENVATVEQLLSHRLGLPRNAFDDRLEHGEDPRLIRGSLGRLHPVCAPGACFTYQNVAFDTISEVVQRVTGRSYQQSVEDSLFAPLGMRDASIGRPGLVDARSWAQPNVGPRTVRVDEAYYRVAAAGGVNSSILDLGLWMQAQLGEAGAIIPQRVLDIIHAPRISTVGTARLTEYDREMTGTTYALGWRNAYYGGHRLVGHRGAVSGYRSLILFDPAAGTGVAVLWNSQSIRPVGIPLELFDMLYGRPRRDWLHLDGKGAAGAPGEELPVDARND